MSEKHLVIIRTLPKLNLKRVFAPFALQFILIGTGVIADSQAMQWAGFVAIVFICIAVIVVSTERNMHPNAMTIKEARNRIDEIEAREQDK